MKIEETLDTLFRGNAHPILRIGGCTLVLAVIVAGGIRKYEAGWSLQKTAAYAGVGGIIGALVGVVFVWRDVAQQRAREGVAIGNISRWLFCKGYLSALLWLPLMLVILVAASGVFLYVLSMQPQR